MDWRDEGVLLTMRPHGESAAIIEVLTEAHGRHAGVVRGGAGRRMAPILQPGAQLSVSWRARLEEHLGAFTVEPLRSRMPGVMGDRLALSGLNAVCGMLAATLPEREPVPDLYRTSGTLLDLMPVTEAWPLAYLHWEMGLLEALGFGLDLSACAVTGATEGLVYISPRTGRAVTKAGAGDWADKLLPLAPCMLPGGDGSDPEISGALAVLTVFWEKNLTPVRGRSPLPASRQRLLDLLARR